MASMAPAAFDEPELMRDLELPAPRRQHLGEMERARLGIVAADESAVAADGHEHDLDAMPVAEVRHDRAIHVRPVERCLPRDLLGGRFELGEVIEILLDDVRGFLAGEMHRIDALQHTAVIELRREVTHRLDGRSVGVEEGDDRSRRGRALGQFAHVVGRDGMLLEQRIGEHFLQAVGDTRV